jgi:4-hydroxybenzoyl-CoA thioesterase
MNARFERPTRIRFSQCDPAGIVFFPQYLVMVNSLLEDWFNEGLGISYANLIGPRRIGTPTVRLECDFKAVSHFGDNVMMELEVEHLGRTSMILHVDCRSGDIIRMAVRQVIVFTDLNTHQPIRVPDDVRQAIASKFFDFIEEK